MTSFFARLKGRESRSKAKKNAADALRDQLPAKARWDDAYTRTAVEPEEIQELIRRCTDELKARALDLPFLLLPFRPASDPSAVRTFIRHFFDQNIRGEVLVQELRMTEPMVIAGIVKWCWGRLQSGVVGWDAYELFKVGEQDSSLARDSFKTFIPLSVENGARSCIIFDFFDLLSAIAAHGKLNGLGGRKLSRMAAWWAFEQKDTGTGFDGGYKMWLSAADATSHLFFAYLRSLSPQQTRSGISMLPMSLQKLLQETEYPPQRPSLLQVSTNRVLMHVDAVSPTPFALLRRANHFQYRDEDRALREFSEYDDPVQSLTEECRRVLKSISSANQSQVSSSKHSTSLRDASWSRFEDIGFSSPLEEEDEDEDSAVTRRPQGLRTAPASGPTTLARPTTPSWADFLSSGFVDDNSSNSRGLLLPPDKVLPPIDYTVRQRSSQSHRPRLESDRHLEPGELASITRFDLDDAFWWVWMSSLAPEETAQRKAAFGRCAVIETAIKGGRWLVMEEMVVGAAPESLEGAYIAEKKGFFSWTIRGKGLGRRKSTGKHALDRGDKHLNQIHPLGLSKSSIGPDQHAKIQAAAAQLQAKQRQERQEALTSQGQMDKRGRTNPEQYEKTTSMLTLQPSIVSEASHALKWAHKYDKEAIRSTYLSDSNLGRGPTNANGDSNGYTNGDTPRSSAPSAYASPTQATSKPLPSLVPSAVPVPVAAAPAPVPSAPISSPPVPEEKRVVLSEKSLEAPRDVHPAERVDLSGRTSPLPPPKDSIESEGQEPARELMASPEPTGGSPDSKKAKKLTKDKTPPAASFRKLFGRSKIRNSKLPDGAAADLNKMLEEAETTQPTVEKSAAQPTPISKEPEPVEEATPIVSPVPIAQPVPAQSPRMPPAAPVAGPISPRRAEPGFVHRSKDNAMTETEYPAEARQEFARFDQGPLTEQPAFVPDDSDSEDAVPPPIARHAKPEVSVPIPVPVPSAQDVTKVEPVPVKDRWAQIRKNAAERAAQKQTEEMQIPTVKVEDGDDTSGEETIESRVARIKARVAELTGNMEGVTGPGSRTPPPVRAIH